MEVSLGSSYPRVLAAWSSPGLMGVELTIKLKAQRVLPCCLRRARHGQLVGPAASCVLLQGARRLSRCRLWKWPLALNSRQATLGTAGSVSTRKRKRTPAPRALGGEKLQGLGGFQSRAASSASELSSWDAREQHLANPGKVEPGRAESDEKASGWGGGRGGNLSWSARFWMSC